MAITRSPWMGTVSVTLADPNVYQLSALLAALAAAVRPQFSGPPVAEYLSIQADPDGGGAKFYIGNGGMTNAFYGIRLIATQAYVISSMGGSNMIALDDIYLMSDTAGAKFNVSLITR